MTEQGGQDNSKTAEFVKMLQSGFETFLDGMAMLGRFSRDQANNISQCLHQTTYPVKESCINGYDNFAQSFGMTQTRTSSPQPGVVHFTAGSGSVAGDPGSSPS
eukprot:GDKH01013658.1.p1 GENE.GDKH01013658.1~~GDKH01013658.1.p1  ORF type:complete len:104 (-),score=10.29 GDKH01013658.1:136-447(-)